ncbi:MAG: sulfurtransferase TusA family protein [Selenomonadaceae bacterium]|nr:sulfurtransferase TusA family protein [Selenomonadaceae bacterium]
MVDARGLSCPLPVVMVQKEVNKSNPAELEVMVDAMVCVENVTRFGKSQGYSVTVEECDGEYKLLLKK